MGLFDGLATAALGTIGGLIGSNKSANEQRDINSDNIQQSREFAQSGVQWRVADAKAAGIHPLAALGMPLSQPASLSSSGNDYARTFADMGQSLGRSADAVLTHSERVSKEALSTLALERAGLENELLRTQITNAQRANNPPMQSFRGTPGLLPGQTSSVPSGRGAIEVSPLQLTDTSKSSKSIEPGHISDRGWIRTETGLQPVPSKDAKNRIEDQIVPELMWAARNYILPNVRSDMAPPPDLLPKGAYKWKWSILNNEWRPVYWK